jgi:hypothetical protein
MYLHPIQYQPILPDEPDHGYGEEMTPCFAQKAISKFFQEPNGQ